MLKIHVEKYSDVGEFLEEEKTKFFKSIVKSIELAFMNKIESAIVAEFHIDESNSIISITIEEDDWDESLSLALQHYELIEDYEGCLRLKQLISDIG